jgi:hypothetical protein
MGLLAVTMAHQPTIAIVIMPAIVTNIWQTLRRPVSARHHAELQRR